MTESAEARDLKAAQWGVATGYFDAAGTWRDVPATTIDAVLDAMGADGRGPPAEARVLCIEAGEARHLGAPALLLTEDGTEVRVPDQLPPDIPAGYHSIVWRDDEDPTRLIVTPRRCVLPAARAWGWAVQLYALRSRTSWGIGDFDDLRRLALASREQGAGMVLVSPLHAPRPTLPQEPSPYFPSSRRFRNPLHLFVDDNELNATGRALNSHGHIGRDAVLQLKLEALHRQWREFTGDATFDAYVAEQGEGLRAYARFCADGNSDQIPFHMWLQWLLDRQLAAAARVLPLVQDLAVGVDPTGADAHIDAGAYPVGISIGAPPDEFNTQGQNWGLLPFDPWRLRASVYEPFIQTVHAGFRHAGGLRVDHVMGLFRMFWIPDGCGPEAGTYVRYPASDLLDILAVESHRAGAFVVGEDLGTVEDEVRAELAQRQVLSYRLLYFDERDPRELPVNALAAVNTHDLPTIAGLWTGRDMERQHRAGMRPNEDGTRRLRGRIASLAEVDEGAAVDDVVMGTYRALGRAPSVLLAATLDDALAVEERPNLPGTTEATNWNTALPVPLEEIEHDPRVQRVARVLSR